LAIGVAVPIPTFCEKEFIKIMLNNNNRPLLFIKENLHSNMKKNEMKVYRQNG
jgi:hypothetical protein